MMLSFIISPMKSALLIPIYEPTAKVLPFLSQFKEGEFDFFLVVDDGSGEEFAPIFNDIASQTVFSVLSYPRNQGKGRALKEGIKKLLEEHNDLDFIVTADGDGQHAKEDIIRVKEKASETPNTLILGSRVFENAPKKSQTGNYWVAKYYHIVTHRHLSDTQTGLRAIPSCLFEEALVCHGERFEYEMNFLKDAAFLSPIEELPIQTIYEDDNKGTHFRAFKDSMRIMAPSMSYLLSGILAAIVLFVSYLLLLVAKPQIDLWPATLAVDAFVAILLYLFRNYVVYHHDGFHPISLFKGTALFAVTSLLKFSFLALIFYSGASFSPLGATWIIFGFTALIGIFKFFFAFAWIYHPTASGK